MSSLSVCFCPSLSFLKNIFIKKNFFLAEARSMQDLRSPTKAQTRAHCRRRTESYPLGCQGRPHRFSVFNEGREGREQVRNQIWFMRVLLQVKGYRKQEPPATWSLNNSSVIFLLQSGIVPGPPVLSFHSFGKS